MSRGAWLCAAATIACATCATAFDAEALADQAPELSASVTGSYYAMRDQSDFGVGVVSVNRGSFRFEARYNYEARSATSSFVGWKFAGGNGVTYEVTPIAGVLFGSAHAAIAGVEASVAYRSFDAYVEAEYVDDWNQHADRYVYAWSEVGWRPVEWLRVGLVGQRTRVVHNDRDLQRGAFVQATIGRATIGVYAFNPDAASRYAIVSVGTSF